MVAACDVYTINSMTLRAPCALTLNSSAPNAWKRPINGRTMEEVKINDEILKAVLEFCYLGDMLSAGDGCELAVVPRCKCSCGKFCQLLPLTINCNLLVLTCGPMFFNAREKCATCSRDLGNDSGYTEPSSVY